MPPAGLTAARPRAADVRDPAGRAASRRRAGELLVPILVCGGALLTLAVGLVAKADGVDWGAPAQPLVVFLRPALSTWALPAALVLAAALYGAIRLHRADAAVGPAAFAAATFALTLATRVALNVFRGGPGALDQAFVVGRRRARAGPSSCPGWPSSKAASATSSPTSPTITAKLPIQAQGHPPGLLLTHALPRHRHRARASPR